MTVAVQSRAQEIIDRAMNMRPLLKKIGRMMDTESRSAFILQRWGPYDWEKKYPNQSGGSDFISVAGALADFSEGRAEPSVKQFQNRPALMGRRSLFNSIRHRVWSRRILEQGSWNPYAYFHQHGLVDVQHIDEGTKKRIKEWIATPFGAKYKRKLQFLTRRDFNTLDTEINQRPFVGIHDTMETQIRREIEGYFNS